MKVIIILSFALRASFGLRLSFVVIYFVSFAFGVIRLSLIGLQLNEKECLAGLASRAVLRSCGRAMTAQVI